jgi:arginyl-tRNA synthetase
MIDSLSLKRLLEQEFPDLQWSLCKDVKKGIISTNFFSLAKQESKSPVELTQVYGSKISEFLTRQDLQTIFSSSIDGPYLSICLNDLGLEHILANNITVTKKDTSQTIFFEYVSPNVAKPIHAGHLRNITIGESIFRALSHTYEHVITDNHLGDWGVQFGVLLWAYKELKRLGKVSVVVNEVEEVISYKPLSEANISFLVSLYVFGSKVTKGDVELEKAVRNEFLLLEKGDTENRGYWKEIVEVSKKEQQQIFDDLNLTTHTVTLPESFYEEEVVTLTNFFETLGLWNSEGLARYIDFKQETLGRLYLISSTGYTTYALRDIAARIVWARDYHADKMITITDHTQGHHFDQFFEVCNMLSANVMFQSVYGSVVASRLNSTHLTHLKYGFLSLKEGKMSTRKGNFLTAEDILSEVTQFASSSLLAKNPELNADEVQVKAKKLAIAAIKWSDLNKDYIHDVVLDIPQILSFEGNTGMYQLYTYARLKSILKKNNKTGEAISVNLLNEEERNILKTVYLSELVISDVAHNFKPHLICNHLYELSSLVNSWYVKNSLQEETNQKRKDTLIDFVSLCSSNIEQLLNLLAISVSEEI